MTQEDRKCVLCNCEWGWSWTDTHGVAQCVSCGMPYRILHYQQDEGGKHHRVDKPPTPLISGPQLVRASRYHRETGAKLSAVGMGLSFPGGYDVADAVDHVAMQAWRERNPESAAPSTEQGEPAP